MVTAKLGSANIVGNWPTPEELEDLVKEIEEEAEHGVYVRLELHAFTATV